MLKIKYSTTFKKDYKTVVKRGYNIKALEEVLQILIEEKPLLPKNLDHILIGDYNGYRECHLTPDWLLIYKIEIETSTLSLTRTGTHSDLF